jgi:hypothetical protein
MKRGGEMQKTVAVMAAWTVSWLVLWSAPVRADEILVQYNAYIGEDDLYNSNGERLQEPWQIIRQDRANYHKYKIRQRGDEGDGFFASVNNRAAAEHMIRNGSISGSARRLLLQGDVIINVKVLDGPDGVYLKIRVE